jgi:hypothetical protein
MLTADSKAVARQDQRSLNWFDFRMVEIYHCSMIVLDFCRLIRSIICSFDFGLQRSTPPRAPSRCRRRRRRTGPARPAVRCPTPRVAPLGRRAPRGRGLRRGAVRRAGRRRGAGGGSSAGPAAAAGPGQLPAPRETEVKFTLSLLNGVQGTENVVTKFTQKNRKDAQKVCTSLHKKVYTTE